MTLLNTFPRKEKALKSRRAMLTLLQTVCGVLMAMGTIIALQCAAFGVLMLLALVSEGLETATVGGLLFVLLCLATVIAFSICCYQALGRFISLCGRLKKGTAFTQENVCLLDKLALALRNGCVVLLPLTAVFVFVAMAARDLRTVILFLPGVFVFLTLYLMVRGVSLLTARAVKLQQDHDLTV